MPWYWGFLINTKARVVLTVDLCFFHVGTEELLISGVAIDRTAWRGTSRYNNNNNKSKNRRILIIIIIIITIQNNRNNNSNKMTMRDDRGEEGRRHFGVKSLRCTWVKSRPGSVSNVVCRP